MCGSNPDLMSVNGDPLPENSNRYRSSTIKSVQGRHQSLIRYGVVNQ